MNEIELKIKERFDNNQNVVLDSIDPYDQRISFIMCNVELSLMQKKVLDVGCGKGAMLEVLEQFGAKLHGIDISEKILDIAKKRLPKAKLDVGSATNIPYPDETFDIIIASEVIEHVPDVDKAISEMIRVLKKGGRLIIIDKNKYAYQYRAWLFVYQKIIFPLLHRKLYGAMYPRNFVFKEQWFGKKEIHKKLENYGEVESEYLRLTRLSVFIGWAVRK